MASKQLLENKQNKGGHSSDIHQSQLKFDGFDFIPPNPDIPAHLSPIYLAAWQNAEGLTEHQLTGNVYIFDI